MIETPAAPAETDWRFALKETPLLAFDASKAMSPVRIQSAAAVLAAILAVSAGLAIPAVPGDFGGDQRADIFWRNEQAGGAGENYLYPMNGATILPTEGLVRAVPDQNWKVAAVADFDGDGKADILWRHTTTGENYLFPMDGTNIKPTEGHIRSVDVDWYVAGVADFDGDGRADILWRNSTTGENYVFPMDGINVKPTEGFIRTVLDQNWKVAAVGDFDGDGKADILWRNFGSGENYIYPMDGTTIKPTEGYTRSVIDQTWKVVGIGDFDGDGKADILWRNTSSGENYIYMMDGTTIKPTEGYTRTVVDQNWQVALIGDFNGDGRADILWRNFGSGENYIYPMNGTTVLGTEGFTRTVANQNWKVQPAIAIATVAACPSVSSADITLPAVASIPTRVSGVAPLYVHFDATGTTATSTARPFHEIEFSWNFGDSGSGNWGPTGLSRNLASGAVAAHVYEKPGTYKACLTAFDGTNTSARAIDITVQDPDVVFAGTKTVCVSTTSGAGSFDGCPANATQVTNANFVDAISTHATAGKRVLFRRGQTWAPNTTATVNPNSSTPGIIGAFGVGANPKIASTGGSYDPILAIGGAANFGDWRVMDLTLDGVNAGTVYGAHLGPQAHDVLLLRVTINRTDAGGFIADEFASTSIYRNIAFVDGTITDTSYAAYFAAEKAAWLGSTVLNTQPFSGVGVFRTQYFTKSVMSNNLMGGSPPGFHLLKFGAPKWDANQPDPLPLYFGHYSELSVVSDNIFDDRTGTGGWMLPFGPEAANKDERVRDIIFERNWTRAGVNTDSHILLFSASGITVRNNLVDMTGGTNADQNGVGVADRGVAPDPAGIEIYNNTIYRGDAASGPLYGVNLYAGTGHVVKNNLTSAPLVSSKTMVNDATGASKSNNLLTNSPGFIGPLTSPAGFKLTAGSPAVNAGAVVPVFSDYFRKLRPYGGARDIGAAEFSP